MADGKDDPAPTGTKRLADAVRAAKIAAAHRSDVVVDIREADRARLEILADMLQPVIDDVPATDEFFDFSLSGGPQPRFWIDNTAHVSMARDRRTYRLVRETRLGRATLAESGDVRAIADRVTTYVAERIVDREKAFAEADGNGGAQRSNNAGAAVEADASIRRVAAGRRPGIGFAASWLLIGIAIGAGLLYAIAYLRGFQLR